MVRLSLQYQFHLVTLAPIKQQTKSITSELGLIRSQLVTILSRRYGLGVTCRNLKLAHAIRRKPDDTSVIQIGVIAVTDAPALDVEVTIDPLPSFLIESSDYFPIRLPILDRATPFYMDATSSYQAVEDLQETKVIISYKDSAGNEYAHESDGSLVRSLSPVVVGYNVWERVVTALEEIERKLK